MDGVNLNQLEQMRQIEEMKKELMNKILTKEAFERLARVKSVNPQLAGQVELYLIQIYQSGKLQNPITDGKLRDVLKTLSEKKEIKIKRK